MLRTLRRLSARSLARTNRQLLDDRLNNITQLVEEIRSLPDGADARGLTALLLTEAEDANDRAQLSAEFTAQATA